MATQEGNKEHVLLFPFMAKGHTIPLLHLTTALTRRGITVTFLTTPANSPFVSRSLLPNPNVRLLHLPFPSVTSLPDGCESTDLLPSTRLFPAFLDATKLLRDTFHAALLRMSQSRDLPLCVVSDFFLWWTLPVCNQFGVPRLVFHGMGVFSMSLLKSLRLYGDRLGVASASDDDDGGEKSFHVPGTADTLRLTRADLPKSVREPNESEPVVPARFIAEIEEVEGGSWGIVVNSFADLDRAHVELFESFYAKGARAWLVGPLSFYRSDSGESESAPEQCIEWLDGKPPRSVVYVSFGTQAHVTDAQLDEIAHGLEASGYEYVWVVRSDTWAPPVGWTGGKGFVVRGWAPQRRVLEHGAIGGFVSHCGWNSVLESVSAGVPVLAWPMIAEQPLNAKYVVHELGAGLRMMGAAEAGTVGRREICERTRELMEGEKGKRARMRAEELGRMAKGAVAEGGSSYESLSRLIEELRKVLDGN